MIHSLKILVLCFAFTLVPQLYAKSLDQNSIENTAIDWDNIEARNKLLLTVPQWSPRHIQEVFRAYTSPTKYDLPYMINGERVDYNALFIQAFWGSKDNPFTKFPRPAKAFLFFKNAGNTSKHAMGIIVRNITDKHYYIFDKNTDSPILLSDWMESMAQGNSLCNVRFNVCTDYGAAPDDVCHSQTYEGEIYKYPYGEKTQIQLASAKRSSSDHWHHKVNTQTLTQSSIIYTSVPWNDEAQKQAVLKSAVVWPNYQVIKDAFEKIRNTRYFQDEKVEHFGRRISWLYPDDGCWTRISAIFKDFFGPRNNFVNTLTRPSKVYAFGNLCVNTENTASGNINWWYHTAPLIKNAQTNIYYVLDPSVNAHEPLRLEAWIAAVSANTGSCASNIPNQVEKFNVCNGYGINPYDTCQYTAFENFGKEISAMLIQRYYRRFERTRQVELGRDPNEVLGDNPPW